jgi:hypothetical protein
MELIKRKSKVRPYFLGAVHRKGTRTFGTFGINMHISELPFSKACERNLNPIKNVLKCYLESGHLIEMGCGTGQHAISLSREFPLVQWHAADHQDYHWMLNGRKKLTPTHENLHGPYDLFVGREKTMKEQLSPIDADFDTFFTANTLHIMDQEEVDLFCVQVGDCLSAKGLLFIYGPFKYDGNFTSESNEHFNVSLMSRGTGSEIKEFNHLKDRLKEFTFKKRFDLPSNNQMLLFQKNE